MPTINDGQLLVEIEGADEDGLRRAILAARKVFQSSGIPMEEAFRGHWEVEGAEMLGTELSEEFARSAEVLWKAEDAAVSECFPDGRRAYAYLAIYSVWVEAEKRIDEMGIRHLNPDSGPHYSLELAMALH